MAFFNMPAGLQPDLPDEPRPSPWTGPPLRTVPALLTEQVVLARDPVDARDARRRGHPRRCRARRRPLAGARRLRPCLVGPPAALALDVFARSVAEIGRADDEDLESVRPGFVAAPRTGRHAHRVPLAELDDLVVELHPPAPAHDHVHLLLRSVRVAVRKAVAGRHALVAQAGSLELERLRRQAELQVRRAVEVGSDVLQVLEVPERVRHVAIVWRTVSPAPAGSAPSTPRWGACWWPSPSGW